MSDVLISLRVTNRELALFRTPLRRAERVGDCTLKGNVLTFHDYEGVAGAFHQLAEMKLEHMADANARVRLCGRIHEALRAARKAS
jgi:hypothetical protein